MIDTWLASDNEALLSAVQMQYENTIGVMTGRAAVSERTLEDGTIVPAETAVGDPNKYYLCIRASNAVAPPDGVALVDADEGSSVLGVWA